MDDYNFLRIFKRRIEDFSARSAKGAVDFPATSSEAITKEKLSQREDLLEEIDIDRIAENCGIAKDFDYEEEIERYIEEKEVRTTSDHAKNIFASTISSVISRAVCQPFDVIKEKIQSQQKANKRMLYLTHLTYVEKGVKGLWRNHTSGQIVALSQTIAQFWTYEMMRNELDYFSIASHFDLCNFLAGMISGAMVVMATYPLEVLQIQYMASKKVKLNTNKFRPIFTTIYNESSVLQLYRGIGPSMVHIIPLYGCKFFFYNLLCDYMIAETNFAKRHNMQESVLFLSGAMSGMISTCITQPLDLLKVRLGATSLHRQHYKYDNTCRTMWQCMGNIFREGGILGFYHGLVPGIIRSSVFVSLQFSVFDKLRDWADDYL